ncbi:MAG: hypothetical protein PHU08_03390 [Dehalococcoidales bacterium]|nr:hypothetical protein [Dehalococcoidales bacterium]
MSRKFSRLLGKEAGITGLETAIILIAFVVVAAVFAYTVLSAGLFATQKSSEAVYAGLGQTQSTLQPMGDVVAYKGTAAIDSSVGKVEFTVTNSLKNGEKIDLTPPYQINSGSGALETSGLNSTTTISYTDLSVTIPQCAWTLSWIGKHTDDNMLEQDEQAVITVWLHAWSGSIWSAGADGTFLADNEVDTYHPFTLEVKPAKGAVLNISRTTPAMLDDVTNLH